MKDNTDYDKSLKKLIELGKTKGFVTNDDIKYLISEDILNIAFDSIMTALINEDIYITSE